MNIEFVKKYNLFEPGRILRDVVKGDAEKLIADGYAVEHHDPTPEPFKKFNWEGQRKKEQEETAKAEKAKIKNQKGDGANVPTPTPENK